MTKHFKVHQSIIHPEKVEKLLHELIENIPKSPKALEKEKLRFSAREKIQPISGREIITLAKQKNIVLPPTLESLLQKRAVRTISGVSPIGILTKPFPCPGKCIYCPTETRMPKSYLSSQPAAARAVRNKFHPLKQVKNRITALKESGHPTSKLEVIVMGGTWSFLPKRYQTWYLKNVFDAANQKPSKNLQEAQKINETTAQRVIGITLETRPDFITEKELIRMRQLGCTRVEMGVQTLDDEVQRITQRGHSQKDVIRATKLLKDFGFKIGYHLMPGLPGSTPKKDIEMLQKVVTNPNFQPDFIKLYPCMVLEHSQLYNTWKKGDFTPISQKDLIQVILEFKKVVPPWVRIMRLMRDIPASDIQDGVKLSNLRQILKQQGSAPTSPSPSNTWPCNCVRCREVGFLTPQQKKDLPPPKLFRRTYEASDGTEEFLSFESPDQTILYALLRLRKPSGQKFSQFGSVLHSAALIREVHSYGHEVEVGKGSGVGQHRGLGKKLVQEAEHIASQEWKIKHISIIAGVGTREYYQKLGYKLRSTYMTKKLV